MGFLGDFLLLLVFRHVFAFSEFVLLLVGHVLALGNVDLLLVVGLFCGLVVFHLFFIVLC